MKRRLMAAVTGLDGKRKSANSRMAAALIFWDCQPPAFDVAGGTSRRAACAISLGLTGKKPRRFKVLACV
jgi:hypothetical protein